MYLFIHSPHIMIGLPFLMSALSMSVFLGRLKAFVFRCSFPWLSPQLL